MNWNSAIAASERANSGASGAGVFGGLLCLIGMWRTFSKAGRPGWAAIVPFYNCYVLFDIAWARPWLFLLLLVPVVNVVVYCICMVKLAYAFGKSGGFAVGLILLPPIFTLLLGFGTAEYEGPRT